MEKTIGIILLVGLVVLVSGSLLWANNTGTVPQASTVQPLSRGLPGEGSPLFGKQASSPAALVTGEVFRVQPDPGNGVVKITYRLGKAGNVVFTVSDGKGKAVRELFYPDQLAGMHRVIWDGKRADGKFVLGGAGLKPVPNGVYSLKMTSPDGVKTTQFTYSR